MKEKVKTVQKIIREWEKVEWSLDMNGYKSKKEYCEDWFYDFTNRKSWAWIMREAVGMHKFLINSK